MTKTKAHEEAARRWGDAAQIGRKGQEYRVGLTVLGYFEVRGRGRSWAEAFADADQTEQFLDACDKEGGDDD